MFKINISLINIINILCFIVGLFYYSNIGYAVLLLITFLGFFNRGVSKTVDSRFVLEIVYAVTYILFGLLISDITSFSLIKHSLFPFAAYVIISRFRDHAGNCKEFLMFFSCGCTITNFLSTMNYNRHYKYVVAMYWNKSVLLNPVNLNLYSIIGVAAVFYALFYETNMKDKIIWLFNFFIGILVTLKTAKYTVIYALLIVIIVNVLLFRRSKKSIFLVAFMCIVTYKFLNSSITNYGLIERLRAGDSAGNSMGLRLKMWKLYFPDMFIKPFSGASIYNPFYEWAHNIFLDVYIQNGIIVMLLLVVIFLLHFVDLLKLLKLENIDEGEKVFWISLSIALVASFSTEPIYICAPILMTPMFMIMGHVYSVVTSDYVNGTVIVKG